MGNIAHKSKCVFRLVTVFCAMACIAASCSAQHTAEIPATSPDGPQTPNAHTVGNISSQAINLTDKEKTLLGDVYDQNGQLYEPPMYGLLAKVAKMEKPAKRDFDNLPWPGYQHLLEHPPIYRAEAMRVKLFVHTVQKLTGANSMYYEKDKPYWLLGCTNAGCKTPSQEPLLVLCPFDPIEILGEPENTDDKDVMSYTHPEGRQFELAGVFYKIHTQMDRGEKDRKPVLRDYPVFIAWDIRKIESGDNNVSISKMMIVLIIIAMAAAFFILKRHVKRLKNMGETESEPYKPWRYEPKHEESESKNDEPADMEVDDELKKAVQEFQQKEKPDDHPAKD